jgi:hypothetical protein
MGKKHKHKLQERTVAPEPRVIDLADKKSLKFWAKRFGVAPEQIAETVQEVGANPTAVALKLEAPLPDRIVPPAA